MRLAPILLAAALIASADLLSAQERPDIVLFIADDEGGNPGLKMNAESVRTRDGWKYIEYTAGETEVYDLNADPWELQNRSGDPAYAAVRDSLAGMLEAMR